MARTKREIHNGMEVIDSRDVIARIEELESLRDDAKLDAERIIEARGAAERESTEQEEIYGKETTEDGTEYYTSADFGEEEYEELKQLTALAEEGSGSPDWKYGETLIRDSYFETYAQELAEDCGMIQKSDQWPNRCIDWEKAADELKQDYFSVEYGDETYWIRA